MAWSADIAIFIVSLWSVSTCLVTYFTSAVLQNHASLFIPHIATTGDSPPESTIFTQMTVLTDALFLVVVHFRYVQVAVIFNASQEAKPYKLLNCLSYCVGYAAGAGLLIVACFQPSNALYIHTVASLFLFTLGCSIYVLIQTVLSWRTRKILKTKQKLIFYRVTLTLGIVLTALTYIIGLCWSGFECIPYTNKCDNPYHITSALSEWALPVLYVLYLLTFRNEFRMIKISQTKILVQINREGSQGGT